MPQRGILMDNDRFLELLELGDACTDAIEWCQDELVGEDIPLQTLWDNCPDPVWMLFYLEDFHHAEEALLDKVYRALIDSVWEKLKPEMLHAIGMADSVMDMDAASKRMIEEARVKARQGVYPDHDWSRIHAGIGASYYLRGITHGRYYPIVGRYINSSLNLEDKYIHPACDIIRSIVPDLPPMRDLFGEVVV